MNDENLNDMDEDEGNVSADANMQHLKSLNRDENGLPISMSKNGGKLPPLSNAPQLPATGLIRMPNSSLVANDKGPGGKMAPMPISKSNGIERLLDKPDEPKYSDYIRLEKIRKFKRLPRLVGERNPVKFTCPSCGRDGVT
jgi:hypothetical protein